MSIALRAEASRAVVVLDGVDRVAFNADGRMELLTPAAGTPTGNDVTTAGQLGFGKMYESPEQLLTVTAPFNLNHNLGKKPALARAFLVCKIAELGWAVGDDVPVETLYTSGTINYSIGLNDTFIRVVRGSAGCAVSSAAGVASFVTLANWRLIVRAWA